MLMIRAFTHTSLELTIGHLERQGQILDALLIRSFKRALAENTNGDVRMTPEQLGVVLGVTLSEFTRSLLIQPKITDLLWTEIGHHIRDIHRQIVLDEADAGGISKPNRPYQKTAPTSSATVTSPKQSPAPRLKLEENFRKAPIFKEYAWLLDIFYRANIRTVQGFEAALANRDRKQSIGFTKGTPRRYLGLQEKNGTYPFGTVTGRLLATIPGFIVPETLPAPEAGNEGTVAITEISPFFPSIIGNSALNLIAPTVTYFRESALEFGAGGPDRNSPPVAAATPPTPTRT